MFVFWVVAYIRMQSHEQFSLLANLRYAQVSFWFQVHFQSRSSWHWHQHWRKSHTENIRDSLCDVHLTVMRAPSSVMRAPSSVMWAPSSVMWAPIIPHMIITWTLTIRDTAAWKHMSHKLRITSSRSLSLQGEFFTYWTSHYSWHLGKYHALLPH